MQAFLSRLGVEVVTLDLSYATPKGYHGRWRNQFYIFDIIKYLSRSLAPEETCLVLDSDCVWIAPAPPIEAALRRNGVLTYAETYPPDLLANGLTRSDMQEVYEQISGETLPGPPVYCGGEFFGATGAEVRRLAEQIDPVWEVLMERFARGEKRFNEEAQVLSYLYWKMGYPVGTADPFIRRIWTGPPLRFNTSSLYDYGLTIWHLPLEKERGIKWLFERLHRPGSAFWSIPTGRLFARYLGRHLGVHSLWPAKLARDYALLSRKALKKAVAKVLRQ